MRRSLAISVIVSCLNLVVSGQNLIQNPSFEHLPDWDYLWVLSLLKPSTKTAVATHITGDAHEGFSCVELSNTDDGKWTFFFTDGAGAPLSFQANRSYEVTGWIRSVELGKEAEISVLWDKSHKSKVIYAGTPDPAVNPNWFRVRGTFTVDKNYSDGYLRLGFKSDKDAAGNPVGRLRFDDFSLTLIPNGTETDILEFSFPEQHTPEIIDPDHATIHIELPYGTDISALAPDHVVLSPGASISPGVGQPQDFTNPVVYTVTAQNGINTRQWTVSVTVVPLNTEAAITSFSVPGLVEPASIETDTRFVQARVSYGTDLSALVPSIGISAGASIDPAPGIPTDFSSPVIYTITSEDGLTVQEWTVVVQHAPNTQTDITSFEIPELLEPATIDPARHRVTATVPHGTDLRHLVPAITVSEGAHISPLPGVPTDFSRPVIYTVTAADGTSMQDWTVTVDAGPLRTDAEITYFGIPELIAPATIHSEVRLITGSVPYGTDLTALVPTISISDGATIDPGSGTVTDFSDPVTYTVTAEDGNTVQHWLVTIQQSPNNKTDITAFSLPEQTGVYSIINLNHTVTIEVVQGTDLTSLTPTISLSPGATISPPSGTSRDFTHSVEYLVTAEDGLTEQVWTVTVYVEQPNTETRITSFQIIELSSPATIDNSFHTVLGSVPFGTDLTSLVPSITVSKGASVYPPSGAATDFSAPVTYTVTAEDGITVQDWLVSIGLDPATGMGTGHAASFRIYPNPARDLVIIELARDARVSLYDLVGRVCYTRDRVHGNLTINVSEFKRGIYMISLVFEDGSLHRQEVVLQ